MSQPGLASQAGRPRGRGPHGGAGPGVRRARDAAAAPRGRLAAAEAGRPQLQVADMAGQARLLTSGTPPLAGPPSGPTSPTGAPPPARLQAHLALMIHVIKILSRPGLRGLALRVGDVPAPAAGPGPREARPGPGAAPERPAGPPHLPPAPEAAGRSRGAGAARTRIPRRLRPHTSGSGDQRGARFPRARRTPARWGRPLCSPAGQRSPDGTAGQRGAGGNAGSVPPPSEAAAGTARGRGGPRKASPAGRRLRVRSAWNQGRLAAGRGPARSPRKRAGT